LVEGDEMKKQIFLILGVVVVLVLVIQFTRMEFVIKLNGENNIELLTQKGYLENSESQFDFNNIKRERYLIVINENEEGVEEVSNNVKMTLEYMKKDYKEISTSILGYINNEYDGVIIIGEDLDKIREINLLLDYIFEGGDVFFAIRSADNINFRSIYRKLGIKEYGDFVFENGIKFSSNVLIKGQELLIENDLSIGNSSLNIQLEDDVELLAETPQGTKLLWKTKYGDGNIIYFNGSMLNSKNARGLIAGSLSKLHDNYIYPIINAKIMYIDDFPSPTPYGRNEKIDEEFDINIRQFYKEIWWPDMIALSKAYKIKYTAVFIGTYDDVTTQASEEELAVLFEDIAYYGKEVLANDGELGIHGYNHQPLTLDELNDKEHGYNKWVSKEVMNKGLDVLIEKVREVFPEYKMVSYVPPSNIISQEGREAVLETDLKIIGSLYSIGDDPDGYEQEFGIAEDGIIELPRFTYKYAYEDDMKWVNMGAVTMFGMSSHFIHPDDLLDEYRSGKMLWGELLEGFTDFNKDTYKKFPWMDGVTASEGANRMINYSLFEPRYIFTDKSIKIYCNEFVGPNYFIFRTENKIEKAIGCTASKIDTGIYLVEVEESLSEITFK